jgi:serine/threonine protein kinase
VCDIHCTIALYNTSNLGVRLLTLPTRAPRHSKLIHPNIVLFIGISITHTGDRYIVTEYLPRGSVWDILHPKSKRRSLSSSDSHDDLIDDDEEEICHSVRTRDLTPERVHQMLLHTARGMTYLHSLKPPIIHRDLKSQNLLVCVLWPCTPPLLLLLPAAQ